MLVHFTLGVAELLGLYAFGIIPEVIRKLAVCLQFVLLLAVYKYRCLWLFAQLAMLHSLCIFQFFLHARWFAIFKKL